MKTRDFCFELPEELIAQAPEADRENARLLVIDRRTGGFIHARVRDLPRFLGPENLLVTNDSRVRKARLYSLDGSEILLIEKLDPLGWSCLVRRSRRMKKISRFEFPEGLAAELAPDQAGMRRKVVFSRPVDDDYLERHGHVPLPPYIRRPDTQDDGAAYQTVFARVPGSSAAPTAGLHFTPRLLDALREAGVPRTSVTLHVGLGTFLPVKSEEVERHVMHEEWYEVPEPSARAVNEHRGRGGKVLAVGTTSLRTLESAAAPAAAGGWEIRPGQGRTSLFITPGYGFRIVDRLLTNFHTPRSTLLMLAAALAGRELIFQAYAEAVELRYRFFSYGDAMLIL